MNELSEVRTSAYDFLHEAKGVIHIGASTGQERDIYEAARLPVIWIEPLEGVFAHLQEYIASCPRQKALRYLVTDVDDKEYDFHVSNNYGWSSSIFELKKHKEVWPEVDFNASVTMQSRTLKSIVERHDIDLSFYDTLVLDVQGAELLVLKGAGELLDSFKWVMCEATDFESYEGGCILKDLDQFFALRGFEQVNRVATGGRPEVGYQYDVLYKKNDASRAKATLTPIVIDDPVSGQRGMFRVAAVTTVPRLGFQAHWGCLQEAFANPRLMVIKIGGAFWEQGIQNGINSLIEIGADYVITIDYDSIFSSADVKELLRLAVRHPEGDVFAPWQVARGVTDFALITKKADNGEMVRFAPETEFSGDVTRVDMAAFGLTLIKVDALKRMPKPWFWSQPNADGEWQRGKVDADSYFWRKAGECGLTIYSANNVRIGHIQEDVLWLSPNFQVIKQNMRDYYLKGRPF